MEALERLRFLGARLPALADVGARGEEMPWSERGRWRGYVGDWGSDLSNSELVVLVAELLRIWL